ncbi:Transposase Tc1-like [Trinorchestia longiramus]|nr:Transposase Tc1-like [Trinorchestia longiramus]
MVVQWPQTTREELKDNLKASGIEASKHTISRALRREGLRSRTPRRTPLLQKRHVKAKLKYANDHLNKPAAFWNSFNIGKNTLVDGMYGRIKSHLGVGTGTRCSQYPAVYTRQLQLYTALYK